MLIDFAKIKGLIPEKGNLKLVFSVSGPDKIMVLIASHHETKGAEKPELRPLLVEGTAEELSREFEGAISDLGSAEKMLVAATTVSRSPKAAVEARKKEISEAVNKTKPAPAATGAPAKTEAQPKGNTKNEPKAPKKDTLNSLFAAAVVDEKPEGESTGTVPPTGADQETSAGHGDEAESDAAGKEQEAA